MRRPTPARLNGSQTPEVRRWIVSAARSPKQRVQNSCEQSKRQAGATRQRLLVPMLADLKSDRSDRTLEHERVDWSDVGRFVESRVPTEVPELASQKKAQPARGGLDVWCGDYLCRARGQQTASGPKQVAWVLDVFNDFDARHEIKALGPKRLGEVLVEVALD